MPSSDALGFLAPPLELLVAEPLRAVLDFCSGNLGAVEPVRGDGHPVIVYPGLGTGALNTAQLRNYLRSCNFDVYDWELGVNIGPDGLLEDWIGSLVQRVREVFERHGRKVSLVGWSLGGIYAREIAKRCPECVRQVVTLGTPHGSVRDANHAGTLCQLLGADLSQLTPEVQERLRERPPVPTTSIYSRSDGVVCWRGCLQEPAVDAENVQVHASHLGMPTHPDVLRVVGDRLAQPEGGWRPYARRRFTRRTSRPSRSRR